MFSCYLIAEFSFEAVALRCLGYLLRVMFVCVWIVLVGV